MLGKTLAHYKILSHIGTGGMGEVYRAHDTKLDREVALKALPVEFSKDPERVARFEREATTLAKLQHANIAAIYGFDKDQDRTFLVMELVEGEDLAERLQRGPIPPSESTNDCSAVPFRPVNRSCWRLKLPKASRPPTPWVSSTGT